ncbi:ketosteroid isomerase-like protein [Mycobacterium sp. AZCC_0083]|nr:ketosteroid isomerase-like protein [Mycobacterium sp. AZCC_0083]
MSSQKAMVRRYTEGIRSGDLAQMVSCLTEDVVWAAVPLRSCTWTG